MKIFNEWLETNSLVSPYFKLIRLFLLYYLCILFIYKLDLAISWHHCCVNLGINTLSCLPNAL